MWHSATPSQSVTIISHSAETALLTVTNKLCNYIQLIR